MSSEFPPELRKELLDDFYAECDELLTQIRTGLAALGNRPENSPVEGAAVEVLFRHLHSLKGISAIVGLRPAELLAHAMEDVLRGISKHAFSLGAAVVDLLFAATQRLEQIITSHRLNKVQPETSDLISRLTGISPRIQFSAAGSPAAEADGEGRMERAAPPDPVQSARSRGHEVWLCSFTPAPQLDARGININSVRERLAQAGEILKATPSVRGKGLIVFEFVVAFAQPPAGLKDWEEDGIHCAPVPATASEPSDPPAQAKAEFTDPLSLSPSHIVRVDLARLDDLMRITGEMVIHRSRLEERLGHMGAAGAAAKDVMVALGRSLREMREAITRVRLVPIAEIFTRMQFVVGDLVRDSEKKVRIVLEGHQTEVDKYLVEELKEPLLHLVRNAVAHGIETAAERLAAGKPAEATITLGAKSAGEFVLIRIRDDGRGLDAAEIRERALSLGVRVPDRFDSAALLGVLCAPGFSTRDQADLAAGRGVGMAVVANAVRELGGTISVESAVGAGTEFTLRVPLTLSIADAIIVSAGGRKCAIPQGVVDEILQLPSSEVRTIQSTEVIPYRGGLLPFVRLTTFLGEKTERAGSVSLLVVTGETGRAGLAVDRVHSQREIVIRPLSDPLLRAPGISGATELGDGRPILILDPIAMTNGVVRPPDEPARSPIPDLNLRAS